MTIHISPNKIDELIVYILKKLNRDVGSVELAKYLYLIDIESIRFTGKALTGEIYNRAPQGPLAQDFQSSTNMMNGYEIEIEIKNNINNSGKDAHLHRIGKKPRFTPDFNKVEKAIINRVVNRNHDKSVSQLKKIAHKTKPWVAVIEYEKKNNNTYNGAIDLSKEEKLPTVIEWEEQGKKNTKLNPDYKKYLEQEAKELKSLLTNS